MAPFRTLAAAALALAALAAARPPLSPKDLKPLGGVTVTSVRYQDRAALQVIHDGDPNTDKLLVLAGPPLHDGTVSLWVAGEPGPGANAAARGFVGVATRLSPDGRAAEVFYIRPTNGRADDQERRNHAVQYVSPPDWPWERLRKETPSRYEAYADMQPGRWVHLRLELSGAKARLYVGDAVQPTLIVNDLKRGPDATGPVALWLGPGTVAHFADVVVTPR